MQISESPDKKVTEFRRLYCMPKYIQERTTILKIFFVLPVCVTNGPLGMITGAIQNWQITASSTYPKEWDKKCSEKYARVYLPNKYGWCSKYKSSSEWLKIDLGVAARVRTHTYNVHFLSSEQS